MSQSNERRRGPRLPPGAAYVQIEAFRGYRATLNATAVLPGSTAGDGDFGQRGPDA